MIEGATEALWLDDISLMEVEDSIPIGENVFQDGGFENNYKPKSDAKVKGLSAEAGDESVKLSWKSADGADAIRIYEKMEEGFCSSGYIHNTATSIEIGNLLSDATHTLVNNKDNRSDLFDCGGALYLEFGYQRPTYTNPHKQDNWPGVPWTTPFSLNGGEFSMGGIIPVWGPIGLDLGFGMDVTYGKYKTDDFYFDVVHNNYGEPKLFGSQYDYASRFRLTMPFYLMPVFGMNVGYKQYVRLHTGPRFALYFEDLVSFHYINDKGKKDTDSYEFYGIGEEDNIQRAFDITWYLGVSYTYKSIGVRVAYEWGLIGRYKNEYYNEGLNRKELYDPRYNNLIISLFIPMYF